MATWRRNSGDITVIKVERATGLWIGRNGGQTHLCATSDWLAHLAQLTSLAMSSNYLVWVRSVATPPPSFGLGEIATPPISLLIAKLHSNTSLNSWKAIRGKLTFEPRRLMVPSLPSLIEFHKDRGWILREEKAVVKDDGGTILLSYSSESLVNLRQIFTFLYEDRRELIDYRLDRLCHRDDSTNLDMLVQYSSFREKYRYWWEDDSLTRDRLMGAGRESR